jgi:hypothetical protein
MGAPSGDSIEYEMLPEGMPPAMVSEVDEL